MTTPAVPESAPESDAQTGAQTGAQTSAQTGAGFGLPAGGVPSSPGAGFGVPSAGGPSAGNPSAGNPSAGGPGAVPGDRPDGFPGLAPADVAALPLSMATMEVLGSMLDNVEEAERAKSAMAAVQAMQIDQARRIAELACHPVTSDGMKGWSPAETARRTIISELACRLRVPEITAENLIVESKTLVNKLPRTWAALMDGRFTYRHAQVIIQDSWSLTPERVAEFETTVLPYAGKLTVSRLKAKSRTIRERLDTASMAKRHESAKNDRHIELDPVEDGMAWLHLYVEAPVAVAMYQTATDVARSLQGPNESRTLAQLRADVLATMILTRGTGAASDDEAARGLIDGELNGASDLPFDGDNSEPADTPAASPTDSPTTVPPTSDTGNGESGDSTQTNTIDCADPFAHIRPRVAIMVPALSLLGLSNEPATLEGHIPIDMYTARRLVGNATSFTRILTHPETGTILSVGRDQYRVPKALKRWLELRDQTCTKPGCGAPAYLCDLDHIEEWQHGGESSVQNLAHLCKKHHAELHHTGWKHEMTPTGIEWTSPTGKKYITTHELDIRTG